MNPFEIAEIGSTGLRVTRLGLGGAPLGRPPPSLSDKEAVAMIRRALSLGVRYVDTATYGGGRSELRYGEALAEAPRDSYVISTKVGRLLKINGLQEVDFEGIDLSNLPALERSLISVVTRYCAPSSRISSVCAWIAWTYCYCTMCPTSTIGRL